MQLSRVFSWVTFHFHDAGSVVTLRKVILPDPYHAALSVHEEDDGGLTSCQFAGCAKGVRLAGEAAVAGQRPVGAAHIPGYLSSLRSKRLKAGL